MDELNSNTTTINKNAINNPRNNEENALNAQQQFQAKNVSVRRGDRLLLNDVNFSLAPQQLLRIIGANGSGKTSLLRVIAGLSEPDAGSLQWQGNAIHEAKHYSANLGYIGHRDGIKSTLTAIENLRFYQQLHKPSNEDAINRVLHKLKLLDHADITAGLLSFGQRRRLAFARLLLTSQSLWLLDEPFTGIDVDGRVLIESICIEHLKNGGMIIMTHHGNLDDSQLAQFENQLDLASAIA